MTLISLGVAGCVGGICIPSVGGFICCRSARNLKDRVTILSLLILFSAIVITAFALCQMLGQKIDSAIWKNPPPARLWSHLNIIAKYSAITALAAFFFLALAAGNGGRAADPAEALQNFVRMMQRAQANQQAAAQVQARIENAQLELAIQRSQEDQEAPLDIDNGQATPLISDADVFEAPPPPSSSAADVPAEVPLSSAVATKTTDPEEDGGVPGDEEVLGSEEEMAGPGEDEADLSGPEEEG